METIHFDITCSLISLFVIWRKKKANSALCNIFQSSLQSTRPFFLINFLFVWWGLFTGTTIRVWRLRFNYLYFHELSARSPLQTITTLERQHQHKNVVTRKRWRIWKRKSCLHFLLQMIFPTTSLRTVLQLWIILYMHLTSLLWPACRLLYSDKYICVLYVSYSKQMCRK
jgi:hypothetical protein